MPVLRKGIIITGAGSGVGRATSLLFLREGWCVTLAGRRAEMLEETVAQAGPLGPQALIVPTNVSDAPAVRALFARTQEKFGRLDVLFNNAGTVAPSVLLEDLSFEHWKSVVDTNLTGAFLCTQEAFKIMKSQVPRGGRIINNGSVSAQAPRPNSAPYTATKHGITGLTKATALDGRKYDIACGQIDIGNAETEQMARWKHSLMQPSGVVAAESTIDLEHVARAVYHVANLPLDVNVQFMTIMATKMPLIGRG